MLQQDKPEYYVIATGEQHYVREFVELSFKEVGIEISWQGEGPEEVGVAVTSSPEHRHLHGKMVVAIDPRYFRPTEVESLIGDASKARKQLGWKPRTSFKELVKEMMASDLKLAQQQIKAGEEAWASR
jgi:GDPmannose 4,6-dehydratase